MERTTGTRSTICSTVRRKTRSCEPGTADSRSGRDLAAGTSSTSKEKYSVPAAWGWDAPERGRAVLLVPTPRPLPSSVSVELSGAYPGKGHTDGLLFESVPRTQPPLSSSLRSSQHGLPARLSHELSVNYAQTSTRNLSEPVLLLLLLLLF